MKAAPGFVVTASHGPPGWKTRAGPAKMRAIASSGPSRQDAAPVLTLPQPISVPLSSQATPAIAASTTAYAPIPCLFMDADSIEHP